LFFSDVTPVVVPGPVTLASVVFFLATVVRRPYHVHIEREIKLTPRRVIWFHHVDARERLRVHFHGKLPKDQTALFYRCLDLPTQLFAVIGDMGERMMPLTVRSPVHLLHRREFMAVG
jgi:hypothetical protein